MASRHLDKVIMWLELLQKRSFGKDTWSVCVHDSWGPMLSPKHGFYKKMRARRMACVCVPSGLTWAMQFLDVLFHATIKRDKATLNKLGRIDPEFQHLFQTRNNKHKAADQHHQMFLFCELMEKKYNTPAFVRSMQKVWRAVGYGIGLQGEGVEHFLKHAFAGDEFGKWTGRMEDIPIAATGRHGQHNPFLNSAYDTTNLLHRVGRRRTTTLAKDYDLARTLAARDQHERSRARVEGGGKTHSEDPRVALQLKVVLHASRVAHAATQVVREGTSRRVRSTVGVAYIQSVTDEELTAAGGWPSRDSDAGESTQTQVMRELWSDHRFAPHLQRAKDSGAATSFDVKAMRAYADERMPGIRTALAAMGAAQIRRF